MGMTSFREVLEKMLVIVVLPVRKSLRKEMELFSPHLVSNTCGLLASIVSELTASALGSEVGNAYLSHPPLSWAVCLTVSVLLFYLLLCPFFFFWSIFIPFSLSQKNTSMLPHSAWIQLGSVSVLLSYYSSLMVINSLWQFWRDDVIFVNYIYPVSPFFFLSFGSLCCRKLNHGYRCVLHKTAV